MKYKLLKDLPGVEAGTIIHKDKNGVMRNEDGVRFSKEMSDIMDEILDNSKWFEPVEEKKSMAERITKHLPYALQHEYASAEIDAALKKEHIVDAPREEDITGEMAEKMDSYLQFQLGNSNLKSTQYMLKYFARMWREKRGKG